jgi:hypothetical protein
MVESWFTIMEDWSYIASILMLSVGGAVLYAKSRSLPAIAMSLLVACYLSGRAVLHMANSQLASLRQAANPFAMSQSSWWYGVYAGHAIQFGGFALGCMAFLVFALRYKHE